MIVKYIRYLVKHYMFAVLALLFTITYWISAAGLPKNAVVFPQALTLVLIPLFLWNFVSSIRGFRETLTSEEAEYLKWRCSLNITPPKVVVTLVTLVYIAAMTRIGFVVSTSLYLASLSYFLGVRQPLRLLLFTVIYTALVYGIFVLWLRVRLPEGLLL